MLELEILKQEVIELLKKLISTKSFSKEEEGTALLIENFLEKKGFFPKRKFNNVFVENQNFNSKNPKVILLNSHHDTVPPSKSWKGDPFFPLLENDKLRGLGSNDAGASVVSLIATFVYLGSLPFYPYKLILALSAEEEILATKGIESLLPDLGPIDLGIVGEPTGMHLAIFEKGLIALKCISKGKSGHAARQEGINAIYLAIKDIEWMKNFEFEKISDHLGRTKITVTKIAAGTSRNVIPDRCTFEVDIRLNEYYSSKEILEIIEGNISSEIEVEQIYEPSFIKKSHPIVKKGMDLGRKTYGSPTLSDWSHMKKFEALKIGPGDSARSHTADEYILLSEIKEGIDIYLNLLKDLKF